MFTRTLQCVLCGTEHAPRAIYGCERCGGILEVTYEESEIGKLPEDELLPPPGPGLWRYRNLLPVAEADMMVSLGEGGTPLSQASTLAQKLNVDCLLLKDESRNPSGSFKDRPTAVGVSKALEMGFSRVVTASSGNAAASLAAYAAKAGLECVVLVPENTPVGKVAQAVVSGARVIKVHGDYSYSYSMAKEISNHTSAMNLTTTFLNPFTYEGDKTVAYEIYSQMNREVPDWILVPTGAGPLLYGIFRGFLELQRYGLITGVPRLVAVQAAGCAPIEKAFRQNTSVSAWKRTRTVAGAIADPLRGYERDGDLVLAAVRLSEGTVVAAKDEEILDAVRTLATTEGIFVEPGAAASVVGAGRLMDRGLVKRDDRVVCMLTGHGLKDPLAAIPHVTVPVVKPDISEVLRALG